MGASTEGGYLKNTKEKIRGLLSWSTPARERDWAFPHSAANQPHARLTIPPPAPCAAQHSFPHTHTQTITPHPHAQPTTPPIPMCSPTQLSPSPCMAHHSTHPARVAHNSPHLHAQPPTPSTPHPHAWPNTALPTPLRGPLFHLPQRMPHSCPMMSDQGWQSLTSHSQYIQRKHVSLHAKRCLPTFTICR